MTELHHPEPRPVRARRLILWDIDGTLLTAGPAARTAFDAAVAAVVGRDPGDHGVMMAGKTDPQIALEILATMAIEEPEATDHLPAVLRSLEQELEQAIHRMRADGRAHPGIPDLLARLHETDGVVQSVLTGNLEPNARIKVALFGLEHYLDLDVGAYGSDHAEREQLVPIAAAKLERSIGQRIGPRDVWVVGDTQRDLACARAGGTRCLLVATGHIALEDLQGIGADAVLPDLGDVDRAYELLTS